MAFRPEPCSGRTDSYRQRSSFALKIYVHAEREREDTRERETYIHCIYWCICFFFGVYRMYFVVVVVLVFGGGRAV